MDDMAVRYMKRGNNAVEGGLPPFIAAYIPKLSEVQRNNQISGAAVEMGMAEGRRRVMQKIRRSLSNSPAGPLFRALKSQTSHGAG